MRRVVLASYLLFLLLLNVAPVPSSPVQNGDKMGHLLEFFLLGLLGWPPLWSYLLPFPVLLEFLQLLVPPWRTFSLADMGANLIGLVAGLLLGWWHEGRHEGAEVRDEGGRDRPD